MDIFQKLAINKKDELFKQQSYDTFLKYKFDRKVNLGISERLSFILNMKLVHDDIYLLATLKRFEFAKDYLGIEM